MGTNFIKVVVVSVAVLSFSVSQAANDAKVINSENIERAAHDPRIPYAAKSDVEFVDALGPHHESAIAMANEVIQRGSSPDVIALATKMRDAQSSDVAIMLKVKHDLTKAHQFKAMDDDHGESDMAMIKSLSGAELDKAFLTNMIAHHGSGVSFVHRSLGYLSSVDLKTIAEANFKNQAEEIGQMRAMLNAL